MKTVKYEDFLLSELKDIPTARAYLAEIIAHEDDSVFLMAVKDVARAHVDNPKFKDPNGLTL